MRRELFKEQCEMWLKLVTSKIGTSFLNYAREKAIYKTVSDPTEMNGRSTSSIGSSTAYFIPHSPTRREMNSKVSLYFLKSLPPIRAFFFPTISSDISILLC